MIDKFRRGIQLYRTEGFYHLSSAAKIKLLNMPKHFRDLYYYIINKTRKEKQIKIDGLMLDIGYKILHTEIKRELRRGDYESREILDRKLY